MALKLTSSAFSHGGEIPAEYTCDGDDLSPPLAWEGIPEGTRSLVLIMDDPDAPDPDAPKRIWVHWVLYNIPSSAASLPRDVRPADLPEGTRVGLNDGGDAGYGGPCPPIGRHRYFHKLYALDVMLPKLGKGRKADLEKAMDGHVVGSAELMGTYQRTRH